MLSQVLRPPQPVGETLAHHCMVTRRGKIKLKSIITFTWLFYGVSGTVEVRREKTDIRRVDSEVGKNISSNG